METRSRKRKRTTEADPSPTSLKAPDKSTMRTTAGILKAPPYPQGGKKRSECCKPYQDADIECSQARSLWTRELDNDQSKKPVSDRELERKINGWMCLSKDMRRQCEEARARGDKSMKITKCKSDIGSIIEIFFDFDISLPIDRGGTLTNQRLSTSEIDKIAMEWEQIQLSSNSGSFYLALDTNYKRMFAYFNKGLDLVYGERAGEWVLDTTTYNIEEYADIHPPDIPKDARHRDYEEWLLSNPKICWGEGSRAGVYHWGIWMEKGHSNSSVITRDTHKTPQHINPILLQLFQSFGNITHAKRLLLGAVDKPIRDFCQEMISRLPIEQKQQWITGPDECFCLRACLINLFTEPHYDKGDLEDGWAVMAPMGVFSGADFCIRELKRRVVCQPGGIGMIRGNKLEHFTTTWQGHRYCLVSTSHESIRREYMKRQNMKNCSL